MRGRLALLAGGAAVAAATVYRRLRRQASVAAPVETHADELRARLEASRAVVDEREQFEEAEVPVDEADEVAPADRRKAVHDRGRHAAEQMRRGSSG